jgi:S-DNA-T family DNA segregation ATPase FtsK/SpoIIIE
MSPEELNFVLVDYKGGSAFDACADLPHTVGVVTDLDDRLASRALICLEAELRYREQLLRNHGASDIVELSSPRALPRLMVIVDEFAALARELPHFMDALVSAAQRGRSLGVHLVLATQRPAGVIGDSIKANTNLRIALRVQDAAESIDVVGQPAAAAIPRSLPGRGLARLGPADILEFQAAHVSGRRLCCADAQIVVRPFLFAHEQPSPRPIVADSSAAPSDLEQIVAACLRAAEELSLSPPRSPWPDPLPERITRDEVTAPGPVFAIADEPHSQRVVPVEWDSNVGNLLLYGLPGSGTTTALAALATALAGGHRPSDMHLYVIDCDDQKLMPLLQLPHVGAVIGGGERERQVRLLRMLGAEMERRRTRRREEPSTADDLPAIVMLIDNYRGLADSFAEPGDMSVHDLLARLIADGPGVGMFTVASAKQPTDIPSRLAATLGGRYIFRLADRYDYTGLGLPAIDPPSCPGRAFESGSAREIQIVLPHENGMEDAVAAVPAQHADPEPWAITVLPRVVALERFVAAGRIAEDEWFLPLGIADSTRRPAGLLLRAGEHALITGPPRSGKTTALLVAAEVARHAAPSLRIAAIAPHRSALCSAESIDQVISAPDLDTLDLSGPRCLLLIDDAEQIDEGDPLTRLVVQRSSRLRIIAAGPSDVLRGLYGHWTQDLRRSRIGCALRPSDISDGDIWHAQFPQGRHQSYPVGRGYLVAPGHTELVQLGHP